MKILHTQTIFFTLILHFYYSSPYTLPDHHFINCGATATIPTDGRNFTGDRNSNILRITGRSSVLTNPNPSIVNSPLYQTARRFNTPSSYTLHTPDPGYYFVRFHFYPFLSLSDARFNLSVSGFTLLHNFSVSNSLNSPLIKEFLVKINSSEDLQIQFDPIPSSFAFVNAIEAFITPENFIDDSVISDHFLQTIHRINVGGSNVSRAEDTLLRNWEADDYYLHFQETARNATFYERKPNYQPGGADEFTAPDIVYKTAKQLNVANMESIVRINMTWIFDVARNAPHFVRAHFCDIMSFSQTVGVFNIFIGGNYSFRINPNRYNQFASPIYHDARVESDNSGFIYVSIGPGLNANSDVIPFLNGLEIMEILTDLPSSIIVEARRDQNNQLYVIIGSVVGGAVFLILILLVFFWFKCKRAKKEDKFDQQMVHVYGTTSYDANSSKTGNGSSRANLDLSLKLSLDEIMYATSNFNPKLMIGEGGFGKVYKGVLKNGKKVAVKRSEPGHGQGLSEFETEITVLSKIQHINLVSLVGYCEESSEMILVYEFMENGTLKEHLYDTSNTNKYNKLSWNKRVEICIGAAKGIHYLHTCLDGGIIHRDLKSTNILLDEKHVAKVADFGLSRLGPPDHSHVSTAVKGTYGYLDPEYFNTFQLTRKSDVYSFGVVLLEVLCARPVINQSLPYDEVNLPDWAIVCQGKGELEKIVDPFLVGKIDPNSLRKFGETVEKCLRENGAERPDIVDVMWDLEYVFQLQETNSVVRRGNVDDSVNHDESWVQSPLPHFANDDFSSSFSVLSNTRGDQGDHEADEGSYNASLTNASSVFSQLKIDGAR